MRDIVRIEKEYFNVNKNYKRNIILKTITPSLKIKEQNNSQSFIEGLVDLPSDEGREHVDFDLKWNIAQIKEIDDVEQLLQQITDDVKFWVNKGNFYFKNNKTAFAIDCYRQALSIVLFYDCNRTKMIYMHGLILEYHWQE